MEFRAQFVKYLHQRDRGWMLSLVALVLLVYLPFLGNPFFFDDSNFFSSDMLEYYEHALFHLDLRWLPYASLGWTATVFSEYVPHFFHLGNTLLHAANVLLLFYLLRQLLSAVVPQPAQSRVLIWGAWFAALLFAVHPVAVYAVGYVIQRSILMATLFALVMQLTYLRALLTGQKRWLVFSVVAYFLAGFAKEHSLMMPAVLFALHILLRAGKPALVKLDIRSLWWCWSAFAAIGVLLVLRVQGVLGLPYEPMAAFLFEQQGVVASTPMLHFLSALTQAGLFFKYLLFWLLPNPAWMSVDMREHFITGLNDWQGWAGGLAFIAYGVLAFRLLQRGGSKGLLGLALLYPWLLFIVELAGIRVQEPFVLYRSYLWMPGVMLLVPLLLIRIPGRKTMLVLGLSVLLLVPLAWNRLWVFGDSYRLWNDAALLLPTDQMAGADRIFFNRAKAHAEARQWNDAAADFEHVVALSPQLAPVRYELGNVYLNLQRFEDALEQFNVGIALTPNDGQQYLGKGLALMRLHQKEQALQQLKKGCELGTNDACMVAAWMQPKK